ncbi:hypothetical protein HCN44_007691 [Aphidius gifuensis]|uniref:Protein kinase domain-containing protein n=1 Tax=Aphidius gifuensis TaxID=684658 RepID=A0A834XK06_APHGI|nr:mitogen-activated protein kinase kinase kinase 4-like isoform X2 [Aphidius gifuensis]KAF7988197.1 hypothetical protein HCN44_007691 [Aphidius gifuensis]
MDDDDDDGTMSLDSNDLSDHDERFYDLSDIYGRTPPRERLNRKQRAKTQDKKKQQRIWSDTKSLSTSKVNNKPVLDRRITMDAIIVSNLYDQAEEDRQQEIKDAAAREGSRQCKRILKLNRGSERDLKLDVEAASQYASQTDKSLMSTINKKIQGKNRFLCLRSKRVEIDQTKQIENLSSTRIDSFSKIDHESNEDQAKIILPSDRELFHLTFSQLINLGCKDKDKKIQCQRDEEKIRWQNEVKDLIWLELQAYHADKSPLAQDEYLCRQREAIGELLNEIMEYKWDPASLNVPSSPSYTSSISISNDSGYGGSSGGTTPMINEQSCPGCLSMYCNPCGRSQMTALRQVESLLVRLEAAEALYPNSQAFGLDYQLYKSQKFCDRVKTMCLWYNITRYHRLKLCILGRLLTTLVDGGKSYAEIDSSGSNTSNIATSDVTDNNIEMIKHLSQHEITSNVITPSDSTNSNSSNNSSNYLYPRSCSLSTASSIVSLDNENKIKYYFRESSFKEFDKQGYRKYIEEVLKTRGLTKSLNFLDRLHNTVLRKASLTFKKLEETNEASEEYEDDWELKRYGVWSPEAKSLNLPPYTSAFIFLSRVPLDVVHEFLRLRLEQKPERPEPLSVRELMREMKEGLGIACMHRDRFAEHSKTVLALDESSFIESSLSHDSIPSDFEDVGEFDNSLQSVFEVYLDYLGQWISIVLYNNICEKSIDAEWQFVKKIAGKIKNGYNICGIKYCGIIGTLIDEVNKYLINRPNEINEIAAEIEDNVHQNVHYMYLSLGREWQSMFVETGNRLQRIHCLSKSLVSAINEWPYESQQLNNSIKKLKTILLTPRIKITNLIQNFTAKVDESDDNNMNIKDQEILLVKKTRIRQIFHQAFRMGFDYYKGICDLFLPDERSNIVYDLIHFAKLWMNFVQKRCDRGRGIRPGWACHGLKFLTIVCDPLNTKYLNDYEFEDLKKTMDSCITHVIGDNKNKSSPSLNNERRISRSSGPSPAQSRSTTPSIKSRNSNIALDNYDKLSECNLMKSEKIMLSLKAIDDEIDSDKRKYGLIGRIVDRQSINNIRFKIKKIQFTWQRGIRIGEGAFGKVYTVVNNQTGELLAMKEMPLQPGNRSSISSVVKELEIFEGIHHKNLVGYYGMEIHREELLIFMELCTEGTLENLIKGNGNFGLSDVFIRKYTHQLVLAVSVLHGHGIVHRDVKSANIFLTDQGRCLKLGDFGSAVKINTHTTMPGEVKDFVGTQAYMAPEVFMKNDSGGHGRAADIWSVACCVIEMASGKRPWHEFESTYQIMFKVGMGATPQIPDNLSQDGVDFLKKCLQHDPKYRPTANALLSHVFIRNGNDISIEQ